MRDVEVQDYQDLGVDLVLSREEGLQRVDRAGQLLDAFAGEELPMLPHVLVDYCCPQLSLLALVGGFLANAFEPS